MVLLSKIIKRFEPELYDKFGDTMLPSHKRALAAWKKCRTYENHLMKTQCEACGEIIYVPHSCGHRNCPHCQNHETEQWLKRQQNKLLPVEYHLLTFNLPAAFNEIAWQHQRKIYSLMMQLSWEKVSNNLTKALGGATGAISILHTHGRDLSYHPHIHMLVPNLCLDFYTNRAISQFDLFSQEFVQQLSLKFGAAMLSAILEEGLALLTMDLEPWHVHSKRVGSGEKALIYLSRSLFKGPILEKNILSCKDGRVIFSYQDGSNGTDRTMSLSGADFLNRLLKHVLPKNFRRVRDFGFLSSNFKKREQVDEILSIFIRKHASTENSIHDRDGSANMDILPRIKCPRCGGNMKIIATYIDPVILLMRNFSNRLKE